MAYGYPDEQTTIKAYQDRVKATYQEAGRAFPDPVDSDAFRWFTRYGFSCRDLAEPAAAAKHIAELRAELGLTLPPTPPSTHRRITGQLRVEGTAYRDDRGYVLPVLCHFGEAFSAYIRRPDAVRAELDTIAAAGYHGIRFWDVLGYYDAAWPAAKAVTPTAFTAKSGVFVEPTADYYVWLEAFLRDLRARGLVAHHSRGDLNAMRGADVLTHCRRVGDVQRLVGADTIALNEACNEAWQNGVPDVSRLLKMCEVLGRHALRATSAADDGYGGETLEASQAYTLDVGYCHGHRTGSTLDRVRHIFSWGYEVLLPHIRTPGWQGEPAGPGHGVTVGREEHPEGLALMAAQAFLASQAWVYMSSHGVFWNGPLASQAGFTGVPLVASQLPADVMTWPTICHGGRSQAGTRVFVANDEGTLRCDHRIAADGRVVATIYAERPGRYRVPVERGFAGEFLTPGTTERHPLSAPAGGWIDVECERGRIAIGRLT